MMIPFTFNQRVPGSSPGAPTNDFNGLKVVSVRGAKGRAKVS
jgi:hypothetical protein